MIKSEFLAIYNECVSLTDIQLEEQAINLVYEASRTNLTHWWEELTDMQLLRVGYGILRKNFGNLTDKEVHSINEAMELTGYPRQSLVRLAKNDTHFIGEILEFVTTNPFIVYQSKRLADLAEQNNLILLEILKELKEPSQMKGREINEAKVDTMQVNTISTLKNEEQLHPPSAEVSQQREGLKSSSTQEKLNAIKSKIKTHAENNAI